MRNIQIPIHMSCWLSFPQVGVGLVIATLLWWVSNTFLLKPAHRDQVISLIILTWECFSSTLICSQHENYYDYTGRDWCLWWKCNWENRDQVQFNKFTIVSIIEPKFSGCWMGLLLWRSLECILPNSRHSSFPSAVRLPHTHWWDRTSVNYFLNYFLW